jgi:hypothetical protein
MIDIPIKNHIIVVIAIIDGLKLLLKIQAARIVNQIVAWIYLNDY